MAKKSITQKQAEIEFLEKLGLSTVKVPTKKNAADSVWPDHIQFISDGSELDHVKDGIYKYVVSETKLGSMVQLYIKDIDNLKRVKFLK